MKKNNEAMVSNSSKSGMSKENDNLFQQVPEKKFGVAGRLQKSLLLLLFFLLAAAPSAFAQEDENTNAKADQTLRSNARVNPSTLAMELSIPIADLPGRGGASMPLVFNYSSKVWRIQGSSLPNLTVSLATPIYSDKSVSGWTSTYGAPTMEYSAVDADELYNCQGNAVTGVDWGSPECPLYYIKRVRVTLPDGSTHELRKDDGIYSYDWTTGVDKTENFLAVDGSRMRLNMTESNGSTLYLADGSRYFFADNFTANKYTDRSGNVLTYNISTKTWTDTLGRSLASPFPALIPDNYSHPEGPQNVYVPGLGSTDRQYQLIWKNLSDGALASGESIYYDSNGCSSSNGTIINYPRLFESGDPKLCSQRTDEFDPMVLTEIVLPNGAKYKFQYNKFGEIVRIDYPTGGYEKFLYGQIKPLSSTNKIGYDQANRGVIERWVGADDVAQEQHWEYEAFIDGIGLTDPYVVITTAPDGSSTKQILYRNATSTAYGFDNPLAGREIETQVKDANGFLRSRKLTEWEVTDGTTFGYSAMAKRDIRVKRVVTVTNDPNSASYSLATLSETDYETPGQNGSTAPTDAEYFARTNAIRSKTYHYKVLSSTQANSSLATIGGLFSSSDLATVSETDYLYDLNYKARNISGLATETRIKDAAGSVKAKTQISYDEGGYSLPSTGTMPTIAANSWVDLTSTNELGTTIGSKRGLPTTVKNYYDITNGYYVETNAYYDQFGNLRKARDGRDNDTETQYDDDYAFAYPTSVTTAAPDSNGTYGSSTGFTTSTTYNYNTGLPTSTTDANNQTTTMSYADPVTTVDDPLLRPSKVTAPNTRQTITEYGAPNSTTGQLPVNQRFVKVKTQIDATNWKEGYTWADGLGRTVKTQSVDSVSGDVFVLTCYDQYGRVQKVTNPFRNLSSPTCSTTTSLEWTQTTYDAAGRVWKVTTADGAEVETTYGLATSTSSQVGTVVTVEDQAGKLRRSVTNALGQLKRVDEPNDSNQLGAIDSPNQFTSYSYDPLNNLITVNQGSQTRSFAYDSLSRLKEAANPESGTITYTYDLNGNLKTKRDARDIKTVYDYDALNRVVKRCYRVLSSSSLGSTTCASNSETPEPNTSDVTYYYDDTNVSYSKGKLTKVVNGNTSSPFSKTEYNEFDIMGRVKKSKQTTDGTAYNEMEYTYNLSGALIEEKYPSGRVVKNVLDNSGDLSIVQSKKNQNSGYWNYAQHFTYTAAGAVSAMQFGNGSWESTQFNNRLQPTQIALGSTQSATDKLKLDFTYHTPNNADNNGNLVSQTITVPNEVRNNTTYNGFTATQTYTYDSLNRIKDAKEMIGSTQQWKQTFTYDRYGNRSFDESGTSGNYLTTTLARGCSTSTYNPNGICDKKKINPTFTAGNNQITPDQDGDSQNDYLFDSSGNTTKDATSNTFIYDGENKQVEVKNSSNQTVGQYWYDGDGKRVKKYVPSTGETTIFVYDASGKMVAEYSTIVESTSTAEVSYLTTDHLGSPRINTDKNGNVTARHDYQPFGEEIQRTSYGNDEVRKQFTGYERDNETDLDFAQARMLNTLVGRFGTPDPYNVILEKERGEDEDERAEILIGFISNPQRWNMYVYVVNNPLAFTDPDGQTPRTINIFLDTSVVTQQGIAAWQKMADDAMRNDKNLKITIYLMDKNNSGAADALLESLKAKNTATIFMGHSWSVDGNKVGIYLGSGRKIGNSQALRERKVTHTADGIDIQNTVVAVFACGCGNAFDNITSSTGTAFVSINQGPEDPNTYAPATNEAAFQFTKSLASGKWDMIQLPGTLNHAVKQANQGIFDNPKPDDPRVTKGDRVDYRILPPPRKKR